MVVLVKLEWRQYLTKIIYCYHYELKIHYSLLVSIGAGYKPSREEEKKYVEDLGNEDGEIRSTEKPRVYQEEKDSVNSTNRFNAVSSTVNTANNEVNVVGTKSSIELPDDLNMPDLEDISIFKDSNEDVFGAEADLNNMESTFQVIPIPITRIHKDHPIEQGHSKEEGIDYDEDFAPIARIEAIRLFLAYASFKDFVIYQMDVKSDFLYGQIEKEVYVCQPLGFEDPEFPDKVYKLEKALYGLHQAPRACQDKYVDEILKKFGFPTVMTASTPMETSKPLMKDENAEDVDVYLYRSMIGSFIYLTSSRPDIMFVYPKDSPFDLEACTDCDYPGASLDRKSTKGGCQFLRSRLISWQCVVDTKQMMDYGYNFMNTKIFIDNESTICIVKNLVFHSKTKHIEIRYHFIRDSYEKRLIQVLKIHTDHNVANLLTRHLMLVVFNLIACIGMLNL
nr:hypothetical protein [Tanacetum cinerariifolium]